MLWIFFSIISLILASVFQISLMYLHKNKKSINLIEQITSSLWLFVIIGILSFVGLILMFMNNYKIEFTGLSERSPLLVLSALSLMLYELFLILGISNGGGGFSSLIAGMSYILVIIFGVYFFNDIVNNNIIISIILISILVSYVILEKNKLTK